MKNIQVWIIKDKDGNPWETPNKKSSWGSIGAAKNAWGCHNMYKNPKYKNLMSSKKWSEHAEAEGFTCVMVAEYEMNKVK